MIHSIISVIVPVYNAGKYLNPLINSVLHQTYSNLELLLVDDGSSDGSADVCDYFARIDSRVRVFHQRNGGQSSARNLGLKEAKGSVISFADHDDILHPRMYETLIRAFEDPRLFVSAGGFANIPDEMIESLSFDGPIERSVIVPNTDIIRHFFTPDWHIPVWNKLYRRVVIDNLQFHGAMLGEDNMFSYQILKKSAQVAYCDTTLYFQRMHGSNFEFTGIRHMNELIAAKEMILQDMKASFPTEYRNAQKRFLVECVRIFNLLTRASDSSLEVQRREIFEALKRNSEKVYLTDLPKGQIVRFCLYRTGIKKEPKGEIVI